MVDRASADVAIIGGGIAGVSLAAELASRESCRVTVFEAEPQLAFHSTGRSAASFLETYGGPAIRALTRGSRAFLESAPDDDPLTPPLLQTRAMLWVTGDAIGGDDALTTRCAEVPSLVRLAGEDARAIAPSLRAEWLVGAAAELDAADIDVMGLHQHDVRAARRAGAVIHTGARLRHATLEPDAWHLTFDTMEVTAGVVVNAAGAWADQVAVLCGVETAGLQPLRRTIAIARSRTSMAPDHPFVVSLDDHFYFKPEAGGVLISPADETPVEPGDVQPDPIDVALALERVNEATTLDLRSVASVWAGLRTFTRDGDPVIGFDPGGRPFFWLAGQGGYGIQTAPAVARLAAQLISGEQPDADPTVVASVRPGRW